jgi:hypothetical protein
MLWQKYESSNNAQGESSAYDKSPDLNERKLHLWMPRVLIEAIILLKVFQSPNKSP